MRNPMKATICMCGVIAMCIITAAVFANPVVGFLLGMAWGAGGIAIYSEWEDR